MIQSRAPLLETSEIFLISFWNVSGLPKTKEALGGMCVCRESCRIVIYQKETANKNKTNLDIFPVVDPDNLNHLSRVKSSSFQNLIIAVLNTSNEEIGYYPLEEEVHSLPLRRRSITLKPTKHHNKLIDMLITAKRLKFNYGLYASTFIGKPELLLKDDQKEILLILNEDESKKHFGTLYDFLQQNISIVIFDKKNEKNNLHQDLMCKNFKVEFSYQKYDYPSGIQILGKTVYKKFLVPFPKKKLNKFTLQDVCYFESKCKIVHEGDGKSILIDKYRFTGTNFKQARFSMIDTINDSKNKIQHIVEDNTVIKLIWGSSTIAIEYHLRSERPVDDYSLDVFWTNSDGKRNILIGDGPKLESTVMTLKKIELDPVKCGSAIDWSHLKFIFFKKDKDNPILLHSLSNNNKFDILEPSTIKLKKI